MLYNIISTTIQQCCSLLLFISAFPKLVYLKKFQESVHSYKLLSIRMARVVGLLIPLFELVVAVCLLFDYYDTQAALAGAVLMATFVVAQLSVLMRGLKGVDCGCFGSSTHETIITHWTALRTTWIFVAFAALFVANMLSVRGSGQIAEILINKVLATTLFITFFSLLQISHNSNIFRNSYS